MNAVSQLHMCGYSRGAAVIIVPMSLPDSVQAALAASCTELSRRRSDAATCLTIPCTSGDLCLIFRQKWLVPT